MITIYLQQMEYKKLVSSPCRSKKECYLWFYDNTVEVQDLKDSMIKSSFSCRTLCLLDEPNYMMYNVSFYISTDRIKFRQEIHYHYNNIT